MFLKVYHKYFSFALITRFSLNFVCVFSRFSLVSLQRHGLYPARLFCPWNYLGMNVGVGCHFLLQVY